MRLDEFVEINPKVHLEKEQEYPYVGVADVTPGHRYVYAEEKRTYKGGGAKFRDGDILFARITPSLENGKIAQYRTKTTTKKGMGSTEFFVFRDREGISDPNYIYYFALTDTVRKPAELSMTGASGRQRADLNVVRSIEMNPPTLSVQRKIAAILSAYDDLIENNTRRIAILEEMAQLLYREWFVHFRFPGHEDVEMVDSEIGLIPNGWEIKSISEAIEINPRPSLPKGDNPYVPMASLDTSTMLIHEFEMDDRRSGAKFQNKDVLLARITPSLENGKTAFVQFLPTDDAVAVGSTEFIVLRSKTLTPEYVYLLARWEQFRDHAAKSMTGASGRQRVQVACFDDFLFAQPDKKILCDFTDKVSPVFRFIRLLADRNSVLEQMRDLLLPRLISSELDVSTLNIAGT